MKSKTTLMLIACLAPAFLSAQSGKFTITGTLPGDTMITNAKAYLVYTDDDNMMVDSVPVSKNKYRFRGKLTDLAVEATIQVVAYSAGLPAQPELLYIAQFYLDDSNVSVKHVKGKGEEMPTAEIAGSKIQDEFTAFTEANAGAPPSREGMLNYIKNHPDSWLNYMLLQKLAGQDNKNDKFVDSLFSVLGPRLQASPQTRRLRKSWEAFRATEGEKLKVGEAAIDFKLPDTTGKLIALSDFHGKYLLLDFWASWCGPCRGENPNLVAAYKRYRDKGLEILGVSLDEEADKKAWLEAIAADQLTWTQVSDLKGWQSEAGKLYRVRAIPTNYLIDPNGIIIAANLRGEALENKLKELLDK